MVLESSPDSQINCESRRSPVLTTIHHRSFGIVHFSKGDGVNMGRKDKHNLITNKVIACLLHKSTLEPTILGHSVHNFIYIYNLIYLYEI